MPKLTDVNVGKVLLMVASAQNARKSVRNLISTGERASIFQSLKVHTLFQQTVRAFLVAVCAVLAR